MNVQQVKRFQTTALGPSDADDGDVGRQQHGLAIAVLARLEKHRIVYKVPAQSRSNGQIGLLERSTAGGHKWTALVQPATVGPDPLVDSGRGLRV